MMRTINNNIGFAVQTGALALLGTLMLAVYKDAQLSLELAKIQAAEVQVIHATLEEMRQATRDRWTSKDQSRFEAGHSQVHELYDQRIATLESRVAALEKGR